MSSHKPRSGLLSSSHSRPVIVSHFRYNQVFSSHYDITTYLIKMDVIVRNAVYNSAQLRGSATGSRSRNRSVSMSRLCPGQPCPSQQLSATVQQQPCPPQQPATVQQQPCPPQQLGSSPAGRAQQKRDPEYGRVDI